MLIFLHFLPVEGWGGELILSTNLIPSGFHPGLIQLSTVCLDPSEPRHRAIWIRLFSTGGEEGEEGEEGGEAIFLDQLQKHNEVGVRL